MDEERRRDRRHPFRVRVVLSAGRHEVVAQTENVSFKGILLRTDLPLSNRQFVRLRITLPPEGDELATAGMVARRFTAKDGVPPGVGVQLYGLAGEQRDRWNRFIQFSGPRPQAAPAPAPGLGVEFTKLTEERRQQFLDYVSSEIPVEEVAYMPVEAPARSTP